MPRIESVEAQAAKYGMRTPPLTPPPKRRALPKNDWDIQVSPAVANSTYAIRLTVERITGEKPACSREIINLGIGDPTFYPLHPPPPDAVAAVREALASGKSNGYVPGPGSLVARKAVAEYHERWDAVKYEPTAVVMTHGVGQALDLIFHVLFPPRHVECTNILLPRPVFTQYLTLLSDIGVEARFYDCIEDDGWQIDTCQLDRLCDSQTRAILITNPGNPTGSNFSPSHLRDILSVADKHKIPIIADEIYGHMTWDEPFTPLASLSHSVPVITLSGLSKRFLVPGWRVGWVALHDPLGVADAVKDGIQVWANRFFGPSSISQAALPKILATPAVWFDEVNSKIKLNADIIHQAVQSIPGLSAVKPPGAFYIFIKIDFSIYPTIEDDVYWSVALYREQAVFVLPGDCFNAPGYFRVVLATPLHVTREVARRLTEFCANHRTASPQ